MVSAGADVIFVEADITNENQVEDLISKTVESFGQLDILFNNAGVVNLSLSHEMELEDWNQTLNVNIDGVFLTAKHAIRQMLKTMEVLLLIILP